MANKLKIPLKGPRLVDVVLKMLESHNLTSKQVSERYGVGATWYHDTKAGKYKSPRADVIQAMYEDLTGRSLVQLAHIAKSPTDGGWSPE